MKTAGKIMGTAGMAALFFTIVPAGAFAQYFFQDINTGQGYYDTGAYLRQNRSGGSSSGSSGTSSGSSPGASSDSGADSAAPARPHCRTDLVPAGASEVTIDKNNHEVRDFSTEELLKDVIGRSGGTEIYMKHPQTGQKDYNYIVGKACLINSEITVGYVEPAKIEAAKKAYEAAGSAANAPVPSREAEPSEYEWDPALDVSSYSAENNLGACSPGYGIPVHLDSNYGVVDSEKNVSLGRVAVYESASGNLYHHETTAKVGHFSADAAKGTLCLRRTADKTVTPAAPAVTRTRSVKDTRDIADDTAFDIPADKTEVYVEAQGAVYNAKNRQRIPEAFYNANEHKIYYVKDGQVTNSSYGKMMTKTRGYVNLDLRGLSSAAPEKSKKVFRDVTEGQYFSEPVKKAREKGWIPEDDYFRPSGSMTRCDFAATVIRALGIPLADPSQYYTGFADVPANHPAAPYVYTGVLKGYWKGQQDGSGLFACNQGLNRAEMAIVLVRVLDLKDESADYRPEDSAPDWALSAIRKVHRAGLMKGLGNGKKWGAGNALNRADTITALSRVLGE